MTCGLADGIELVFIRSGIRVRPYDVDIRSRMDAFDVGRFEVSEEAGQLIAEKAENKEPVNVRFDGKRAHRFYIPPENGVEFNDTLQEDTVAHVNLKDPLSILQYGTLDHAWTDTTLDSVIRYIFNNREDPESVIREIDFVREEEHDAVTERVNAFSTSTEIGRLGLPSTVLNTYGLINTLIETFGLDDTVDKINIGPIEFNGISPFEALQKTLEEVGYSAWVDVNGKLKMGTYGSVGEVVATTAGDNGVALQRYSVVQRHNNINLFRVSAPYDTSSDVGTFGMEGFRVLAEAKIDGVEGETDSERLDTRMAPGNLEDKAARALISELFKNTNGTIIVNGLASRDTEVLSRLQAGDYILVDESIAEECDEDVITGAFVIERAMHTANERRGWEISLDVSQVVPPGGSVETKSVLFNPEDGRVYQDLESYAEERADRSGVLGEPLS